MGQSQSWRVFDLLNDQNTLIVQSMHPMQWSSARLILYSHSQLILSVSGSPYILTSVGRSTKIFVTGLCMYNVNFKLIATSEVKI